MAGPPADLCCRVPPQASGNPAAAAVAFGGGDALLEQRAELEDQLELALKECGLLQDQVTTLSKVCHGRHTCAPVRAGG